MSAPLVPLVQEEDAEEAKELLQQAARCYRAQNEEGAFWALWELLALILGEEEDPLAHSGIPVKTECCRVEMESPQYPDTYAVRWNPYNLVVQCHACGAVYAPVPPAAPPEST